MGTNPGVMVTWRHDTDDNHRRWSKAQVSCLVYGWEGLRQTSRRRHQREEVLEKERFLSSYQMSMVLNTWGKKEEAATTGKGDAQRKGGEMVACSRCPRRSLEGSLELDAGASLHSTGPAQLWCVPESRTGDEHLLDGDDQTLQLKTGSYKNCSGPPQPSVVCPLVYHQVLKAHGWMALVRSRGTQKDDMNAQAAGKGMTREREMVEEGAIRVHYIYAWKRQSLIKKKKQKLIIARTL